MTRSIVAATLVLAPLAAHAAGEIPARDFAVRAGRVLTISGAEIAPGVVVVKDGRFADVGGADTIVPDGLPVVEAGDRVLMPGFVEVDSQRGLERQYEVTANASFVRITDGMNPASLEIEDARRNGITTLLVAPSERAFMAGRGAILHPQGIAVDSMIVKQDAALKISLEPSGSESRMGRLSKLRQVLDETKRWMDERRNGPRARKDDARAQEKDSSREALVALLDGTMPALIHCATAADVGAAFGLARDYGFRVHPVIGPGAWRAAPLLKVNGVTAVLTPRMEAWERQPDGTVLRVELPRVLHDAGVPFTLSTDPYDAGAQHPWYQAALAVRSGVPRDVALASVTRTPARLLGFGARKGVIEKGADADFLLLSGDPLSGLAFVEESYIRGARIYSRDTDEKMKRLLSRTSEPPVAAISGDDEDEELVEAETAPPGAKSVSKDPSERVNRWPFAWGPR